MKPGAYLLINVASGKEHDVHTALMKKDYVYHARIVTGLHDIICYVEDEEVELMKKHIYELRKVEGIVKTVSCIAFNHDDAI